MMDIPPPAVEVQYEQLLCQVSANPSQFHDKRVTVRGGVQWGHPESMGLLVAQGCIGGISFLIPDSLDQQSLYSERVTFVTVTGTVNVPECRTDIPSMTGSSCGPWLSVERLESVSRSNLCWRGVALSSTESWVVAGECREPVGPN
jgi:hypothetical protein